MLQKSGPPDGTHHEMGLSIIIFHQGQQEWCCAACGGNV